MPWPWASLHIYFYTKTSKDKNLPLDIHQQSQINKHLFSVREHVEIYLLFQGGKMCYYDYSEVANCYPVSASCYTENILFLTWIISIQIYKSTNSFWCLHFFKNGDATVLWRLLSNHKMVRIEEPDKINGYIYIEREKSCWFGQPIALWHLQHSLLKLWANFTIVSVVIMSRCITALRCTVCWFPT